VTVVSNTSPICYLAVLGCADVLPALFGHVFIPHAVHRELSDEGAPQSARALVASPPSWLELRDVTTVPDASLDNLDPGEREAIALAEEVSADLVLLDEAAARRLATVRGLRVTGLLGVLTEAAALGLIDLPEVIARLRKTNFRASAELLKAVLDRGGTPSP
jgi:predicted nucleic acid-binding protein